MDKSLLRSVEAVVMANWPARNCVDAIALLSGQDPQKLAKEIERLSSELVDRCFVSPALASQYLGVFAYPRKKVQSRIFS
jgi:hypothetical protein